MPQLKNLDYVFEMTFSYFELIILFLLYQFIELFHSIIRIPEPYSSDLCHVTTIFEVSIPSNNR